MDRVLSVSAVSYTHLDVYKRQRLEKLDNGDYAGLVLAAAGLKRLGLEKRISRYFDTEEMVPAAGQGILAVQGRKGLDYEYLEEMCIRDRSGDSSCGKNLVWNRSLPPDSP